MSSNITRALRDSIAGSSFSDKAARARARDIEAMGRLVASGPRGMAASVHLSTLRAKYPAEALQIDAELREKRELSLAEAQRLVLERRREADLACALARERQARHDAAHEAAAFEDWLALGGRP